MHLMTYLVKHFQATLKVYVCFIFIIRGIHLFLVIQDFFCNIIDTVTYGLFPHVHMYYIDVQRYI